MKRILSILGIIVIMTLFLTSCKNKINLNVTYNQENKECTIINTSDYKFENVEVTLLLQNDNGYQKEITKKIDVLKKGYSYSFNLEETDIDNILIVDYNVPLTPVEILFIVATFIFLLLGIFAIVCAFTADI